MTGQLENKVALVTGGAQGIGRAIASQMTVAGATVIIGDLTNPDDGSEWIELDVALSESVAGCVEAIVDTHGRLDIVVNNAGIMFEEDIAAHSEATWNKMLAINLTGPFLVAKAAVPHLKASQGTIVNVGSIEGFSRNPGHVAYSASKAGVHGLTGALAVDLGPFGIRVNAVAPGWIDTSLNASYVDDQPDPDKVRRELAQLHPIGHIGDPTDVGDVVVWLASDQARFVTGQVITVDGGRLSRPPLPPSLSMGE